MKRRDFVKSFSAATTTLLLPAGRGLLLHAQETRPDPSVKRVLAMFKCHFDAGFIDTQANVVHKYFKDYFPHAIEIARAANAQGQRRYAWTTGSWLLFEYLEQASASERSTMEEAIKRGDIAWHALPFTWQTELLSPSMIEGSLALSQSLDRRFGVVTTGAKMTDVPGHTRGLIPPLAKHGVGFLDIGVNDASTPAQLPPLFLWKDPSGAALPVMYHYGYGGITRVPGSDLALSVNVRGDNSGPHTPREIAAIHADLASRFPNAQITAANLSEIAEAVTPHRGNLPVITQEIGDTWIYGCPSDPLKLARFRELSRLRDEWLAAGAFQTGDATDLGLLRHILLEAEHTWGTDTKTWLDFDNQSPPTWPACSTPKTIRSCNSVGPKSARTSSTASTLCPPHFARKLTAPWKAEACGARARLSHGHPRHNSTRRDNALYSWLRPAHRIDQPPPLQSHRPRVGYPRPLHRPVHLPDPVQEGLRPLYGRLPQVH